MPAKADRSLPGVSFIVPVYNKAPYLNGVLAAIRAQRGEFPRQYVFVDDGSSDGSLEIVRRATEGWDDTVIETQSNHGSAHATNRGIELADQPYAKLVDADDLLTHDATLRLLTALAGSDAGLAYGDAKVYTPGSPPDLEAPLDAASSVERIEAPLKLAIKNSLFNPSQALIRTECLRDAGGCDERIVFGQDYSLTLRLAAKWDFLKIAATVAYLPTGVPGRVSGDQARELRDVTAALALFLRDNPGTPKPIQRFACRRAAGRAWKFARRHLGAQTGSEWYWLNLKSVLDLVGPRPEFIERCAAVYDRARPAAQTGETSMSVAK